MKIEAVCFVMDGTLIRNTDSVRYLCGLNGNLEPLVEIENRENEGTITWIEADHFKARLVAGLDFARVESEFGRRIDLIHNIEAVLAYLKARQIRAVLFGRQLQRLVGQRERSWISGNTSLSGMSTIFTAIR